MCIRQPQNGPFGSLTHAGVFRHLFSVLSMGSALKSQESQKPVSPDPDFY